MKKPVSAGALDAILDLKGHEPCPGVEIEFRRPLGSAPGGPGLHATIFRPAIRPATPAPALLTFHGGGFQFGDPNGCGRIAKYLALALGMTTVSASYRLATEETVSFPGLLDDALHAWRWLQSRAGKLHIDPARVAVSGESGGVVPAGHLAVSSPYTPCADEGSRPAAWQAAGAHSELKIIRNIGHGTEGDNRAQRTEALRIAAGFLEARL